ncbi:MAG: mandelate racemase/muconate lactonizing enzyme family protein [bacterium]|nr:mandelate racemase/muconate lactonizing enzyme family protein [bacterium]
MAQIANQPILNLDGFDDTVTIASLELLRNGDTYLSRVRTEEGAEGIAVANDARLRELYPIFVRRIAPFFIGKDAKQLESLLVELYRHSSNYKLQGIALWAPQAAAEMAILDLLGKLTNRSLGNLLGGVKRTKIQVYRASSHRGNAPEEEVEYLKQQAALYGASAVKFRLGGRMSNNVDSLPGRSEALIPMVREAFGPEFTLYADSNSSYDVANALRIGRLMEEYDYHFFEEPCPFDHLWETKQVADQLRIPIAGGEQEFSLRRFRWAIAHRVMDVIQPDLHYFGGYLRTLRVARMANAAGLPCTVHMSGSGLGYVDVCHLASCIDDPGPHQEFKGESDIPFQCATSSLRCEDGFVQVPTGAGNGVTIDPDFLREASVVKA